MPTAENSSLDPSLLEIVTLMELLSKAFSYYSVNYLTLQALKKKLCFFFFASIDSLYCVKSCSRLLYRRSIRV